MPLNQGQGATISALGLRERYAAHQLNVEFAITYPLPSRIAWSVATTESSTELIHLMGKVFRKSSYTFAITIRNDFINSI